MGNSSLITNKINELIKLAEMDGDYNTRTVLLALNGSRLGNVDGMLASKVQEYVADVLIPKVKSDFTSYKASLN